MPAGAAASFQDDAVRSEGLVMTEVMEAMAVDKVPGPGEAEAQLTMAAVLGSGEAEAQLTMLTVLGLGEEQAQLTLVTVLGMGEVVAAGEATAQLTMVTVMGLGEAEAAGDQEAAVAAADERLLLRALRQRRIFQFVVFRKN